MKNEGICRFCLKTFSGRAITRHLQACKVKKEQDAQEAARTKGKSQVYWLKVEGYSPFWLHLEMNDTATLEDLDTFLRYIWLECCGHLSHFDIEGIWYERYPDPDFSWGGPPRSMRITLKKVLGVGSVFEYQYDYGSTTYLSGKVVAVRPGKIKEKVRILARNNPPEIPCANCGKPAEYIAILEDGEAYCEDCLNQKGIDEDATLPVANSPRMGECGYIPDLETDPFMVERFGEAGV